MRFVLFLSLLASPTLAAPPTPTVTDPRLTIELVAAEPDIVTPTGMAVDEQGRLWVIENHTHQRPPNYKGPETDRIRVFSEPDENCRYKKITTFADGFKNAMSIALRPDGVVLVATRSEIIQLRDTKNKGEADERKTLVKLDSPGNYPHNGLAGFAFDGIGWMYFGLGENLGAPYKLIGSDGSSESGGGEGGSVYRCKPDGSKLERIATGTWNTFHMTFDAFGHLFAVDNDPDARGPCRLLHIVQGGDYGYRFRNGRRGLHPFTAWNGELPGTLPMVAGTAEAPSGILAYESNGLPKEYVGKLLVTSWGDHVVEMFTLEPKGASFTAKSSVLVKGGEDFRPVAIVTGPDGSVYLTDWANKSYPVHGHGRIWRIRMKEQPKDDGLRPSTVEKLDFQTQVKLLKDPRIEIRNAAARALASARTMAANDALVKMIDGLDDPRAGLAAFWADWLNSWTTLDQIVTCYHGCKLDPIRAEAARMLDWQRCGNESCDKLIGQATKDTSPEVRALILAKVRGEKYTSQLVQHLADADPFIVAAAIESLGRPEHVERLMTKAIERDDSRIRLGILLALRRSGEPLARKLVPHFLSDKSPDIRRAAIQWVGEERLKEHRVAIEESAAKEPVTKELFEALLASQDLLSNTFKPNLEAAGEGYIAKIVIDDKKPEVFRTFALRMLRPDHPAVTPELLGKWLKSSEKGLPQEALRTLAMRTDEPSQQMLRELATDEKQDVAVRKTAIMGLAASANKPETQRILGKSLGSEALRNDALRSMRDSGLDNRQRETLTYALSQIAGDPELIEQTYLLLDPGKRPAVAEDDLRKAVAEKGDAAAGERVFFHIRGANCASCHRIDGRGGQVGPDLSMIGASHDRAKLIESILNSSKEIAPMFTNWQISMTDGKTHTGIIVGENFDSTITLADATGKLIKLKKLDIEDRRPSPKSLMPDDLHKKMTVQEFRDLLEYLGRRKP